MCTTLLVWLRQVTTSLKAMPCVHNLVGLTLEGDRVFKGHALCAQLCWSDSGRWPHLFLLLVWLCNVTAFLKAMPWVHNLVGLTPAGDRIFKSHALCAQLCWCDSGSWPYLFRLVWLRQVTTSFKAMPWAHNLVGLTQTGDRIFKGTALGACITFLVGLQQVTAFLEPCSRRTTDSYRRLHL